MLRRRWCRDLQVGQQVRAKVVHVDAVKARVFLSIRKTKPNPLLETLDSLVTSSTAAAAAAAAGGSADGSPAAGGAGAGLDQRPVLGDLPEALRFCEVLRAAPGVVVAELGVRLQSRAAAQELEVYMASKDQASSIGAAVTAAGGAARGNGSAELAVSAAADPSVHSYNLVLRKETSVQEVEVVASLAREEVKQLAAAAVATVAAETAAVVPQ